MGQKVHPIGIRLGIVKDWSSKWYADSKTFSKYIFLDHKIRVYIKEKLKDASVSAINIERPAAKANITIMTARPGIVIGKKGEDIEKLRKMNLAKGGSLENALVIKDNKVLNNGGLRNNKEFVNHKILDCIGDLYLSGYKIIGKVICSQGGHKLTNQLLREVYSNKVNFTIVEIKEKIIPHSLINRKYLRSIA